MISNVSIWQTARHFTKFCYDTHVVDGFCDDSKEQRKPHTMVTGAHLNDCTLYGVNLSLVQVDINMGALSSIGASSLSSSSITSGETRVEERARGKRKSAY